MARCTFMTKYLGLAAGFVVSIFSTWDISGYAFVSGQQGQPLDSNGLYGSK